MTADLFTARPQADEITLRPYQEQSLQAIAAAKDRGVRRQLLVLATGLGKTTVFGEQIRRRKAARPDERFLVLAHRDELLEQAAARIQKQNPWLTVGIESGNSRAPFGADVVVAGVQTLGRKHCTRLLSMRPGLIVTDEAHHAAADSYMEVYRRYGVFEGGSEHLGVTATPHRLDNKPLHGTEAAVFEEVPFMFSLKDGVMESWLADLRGYRCAMDLGLDDVKKRGGDYAVGELAKRVNTPEHNAFAFEKWKEVAPGRKTLVFCVDVQHAKDVAEEFNYRGIPAASIDGTTHRDDRRRLVQAFRTGQIQVLANCEIATEGFDVPDASCVLLLRPTQSWALYVQMVGRGTRTVPGTVDGPFDRDERRQRILASEKPDCVVLDVVDNTERHSAASLPKVLDLPPGLDLNGSSLREAQTKLDKCSEFVRGALFSRQFTMEGFDAAVKEVDLLSELKVADEAVGASKYSWLKIGEAHYVLSCGSVEGERNRQGVLKSDALGNWTLIVKSDQRCDELSLGDDLTGAFRSADDQLRGAFGASIGAVAGRNARWKNLKPTDSQLGLLKKLGVPDSVAKELDRGSASALITRKLGEKGR